MAHSNWIFKLIKMCHVTHFHDRISMCLLQSLERHHKVARERDQNV